MKSEEDRTFTVAWRFQKPTAENKYTTGFCRLLALGKTIRSEKAGAKLWYHSCKSWNWGNLKLEVHWGERYRQEMMTGVLL